MWSVIVAAGIPTSVLGFCFWMLERRIERREKQQEAAEKAREEFGGTFLYMGSAELKPYDVWLAAYRTRKPAPGWPFGMWQYTSTARMPGVSTNVDMSHAYKDYAAIIRRAGLGAVKGAEK